MSTPTGAGYGFVGSTFGETDLVSPYLKMYDIPKKEAPKAQKLAQPFAVASDNEITREGTSGYIEAFQNPLNSWNNPVIVNAIASGEASPDIIEDVNRALVQREGAQKAIQSINEAGQQTHQQIFSLQEKINEEGSNYDNFVNNDYLSSLDKRRRFHAKALGSFSKNIVFQGTQAFQVLTPQEIQSVAASMGFQSDDEIAEFLNPLLESGAITQRGDAFVVNTGHQDFFYDQKQVLSSDNFLKILDKLDLPVASDTQAGVVDGVYYESSSRQRLDIVRMTGLVASKAFKDLEGYTIDEKGNVSFLDEGGRVPLTKTAQFATKDRLSDIEIDEQGRVSQEDAKRILETMTKIAADRKGYSKKDTRRPTSTGGGKSPYDGVGTSITEISKGVEVPIKTIPANKYRIKRDGGYGSSSEDISVKNAGRPPKHVPVNVDLHGTAGKMDVSEMVLSEDGKIYVAGTIPQETISILFGSAENQENRTARSRSIDLFKDKSDGYTHFLEADSNMIAALAQVLQLYDKYPKLRNNKARLSMYIQELDIDRGREVDDFSDD